MARVGFTYLGISLVVTMTFAKQSFAEVVGAEHRFYPIAHVGGGYGWGAVTYDGPVYSAPSPQHYESTFRGALGFVSLGAGYQATRYWAVGIRAQGGLAANPTWQSPIPGAGLTNYGTFGAQAFARWLIEGAEGPALELGAGYAQLWFGRERDEILFPGAVQDEAAYGALHGFAVEGAFGWVIAAGAWGLEPRLGLAYLTLGGTHGGAHLVAPTVGLSLSFWPLKEK